VTDVDVMIGRARKKFQIFDADGSGMLDGAEMEKLAQWVWSSFHPDGQPLSAEELAAESRKILKRVDANEDGKMDFAEFESYFRRTTSAISNYRRGVSHGAAGKLPPSRAPELAESRSVEAKQPTNVEPVTSLAVNMDQLSTVQASTATPPVPNPHGGFDAHAPSAGGQGDTGATASSMDEPPSDLNATEATR
jgi:hypothetical protein